MKQPEYDAAVNVVGTVIVVSSVAFAAMLVATNFALLRGVAALGHVLGELGAKIKKNPDDAQKLLSEKGLTTQSFEQQVRQVSQDPEASKRYAAAYKKAA